MEIKHAPQFDTKKVCDIYSEKDGVPVKYVCTTDLKASDVPVDVFYRSTPHPKFGNRYFGLYTNVYAKNATIMIVNADMVEELEFGMITDKDGNYWYSASHHDCLFIDDKMIDGGRRYIRSSGVVEVFRIKDGEFIKEGNLPDEHTTEDFVSRTET